MSERLDQLRKDYVIRKKEQADREEQLRSPLWLCRADELRRIIERNNLLKATPPNLNK